MSRLFRRITLLACAVMASMHPQLARAAQELREDLLAGRPRLDHVRR